MAITPFHFKLKKTSKREQRILEAVYSYLPDTGMRESFISGMQGALAAHLGEGVSLRLEAVQQGRYSSFIQKMPDHPILLVISMPSARGRLLCEIDAPLAMMAVERLLGGQLEELPQMRPLSDSEKAVLQYLILKLLEHVHNECGRNERVHFCFDRFAETPDSVSGFADGDSIAVSFVFRFTFGRHCCFVRLLFPEPFVDEAMLNVEAPQEQRPLEGEYAAGQLNRFAYVRTPIWAEGGRTTLMPADLMQLENGDVIFFEQGDLRLAAGGNEGRAVLRIGNGLNGGLDVDVSLQKDKVVCFVRGLHKGT